MKPILINNLELARSQDKISGKIDAKCSERLTEVLDTSSRQATDINYTLASAAERLHLPSLHLIIEAALAVQCQRCLETMTVNLSLTFDYVVSVSIPEELEGDDDIDWLEASKIMDLSTLIEDELLLALPIAPTHETDCSQQSHESGEKPNPFAVLKDLIK